MDCGDHNKLEWCISHLSKSPRSPAFALPSLEALETLLVIRRFLHQLRSFSLPLILLLIAPFALYVATPANCSSKDNAERERLQTEYRVFLRPGINNNLRRYIDFGRRCADLERQRDACVYRDRKIRDVPRNVCTTVKEVSILEREAGKRTRSGERVSRES